MTSDTANTTSRRVLHIGKYFPPHRGGIETVLRDQLNMQSRDEGLQVAAVVHSSKRRLTGKVEVQPLGYRVSYAARWFTAAFAPISPFFWNSVAREITKLNPTEIRIHMPNVSAFWLLMMPSARTKDWVIVWHSDVVVSTGSWKLRPFHWLYRFFEKKLLLRATTICPTSLTYAVASQYLAPHASKWCIEEIRLDATRFPSDASKSLGVKRSSRTVNILCVGRLTYYKSFETAIEATALSEKMKLRIVGIGPEASKLKKLAKSLNLNKQVEFLGELGDEQLFEQYRWCDALCLPSRERTEALGVVILEAAIFGKPSIVADTEGSGMSWIAPRAHKNAKQFRANNCSSLAAAVKELEKELMR